MFFVCLPNFVLRLLPLKLNYKMQSQQGDPIEQRYKEYTERGSVIDQLAYCINSYREAAMSNDQKFDHIDLADKQKVCLSSVLFLAVIFFCMILFVLACSMVSRSHSSVYLALSRFLMSALKLRLG